MKKNRKERACSPFSSQSSISTMSRLLDLRTERDEILAYPPPQLPPVSPSSSPDHISPTILLIIVILAAVFFISGLVHLLIRFFTKKPSSSIYQSSTRQEESSGASHALQRQLQQLFRLHDSGLDQASIDALPVFYYKHIIGLQEPFDCAVCLCEFSDQDKLRLLPVCSHAFHIQCIDTWLLSNSTCPLCRGTLVGSEIETRMVGIIRESVSSSSSPRPSIMEEYIVDKRSKQIYSVRLGKFRNFDQGGEITRDREGSGRNLDARRCYSMGSYRYIVGDSDLQVALSPKVCKTRSQTPLSIEVTDEEGKKINGRSKGESFSVSKIWLWPKNSRFPNSSNIRINMPAHTVTVQNDYRI